MKLNSNILIISIYIYILYKKNKNKNLPLIYMGNSIEKIKPETTPEKNERHESSHGGVYPTP